MANDFYVGWVEARNPTTIKMGKVLFLADGSGVNLSAEKPGFFSTEIIKYSQ
jgi:hypothetical protein